MPTSSKSTKKKSLKKPKKRSRKKVSQKGLGCKESKEHYKNRQDTDVYERKFYKQI